MESFDLKLWKNYKAAGGNISQPALIDQIAIDSRRIDSPNSLFVALSGSVQDGHQFVTHAANAGARYALVHKDWNPPSQLNNGTLLLRVDDPLQAFQEIVACYRQQMSCTVIAITGSFGKTMLKDLLHAILSTTKKQSLPRKALIAKSGYLLVC